MTTCTIQDVFEFYELYPELKGQLYATTKHGHKSIEAVGVTSPNSVILRMELDDGQFLECSPDHRVWSSEGWEHVKKLERGDVVETSNGWRCVTCISKLSFTEDLYDFQVANVQEYYTNGVRSHNSTILEALVFALYNKSFRKTNKPQIVNSINGKNTLVEIWFKENGNEYHIRRGIKPTVFEIYQNNELIEQDAKNTDYQKMLENNILKINFLTFCQCVVLSTSNFKPFMELNTGQRREVIENLLDINVFTIMNKILKDKSKETAEQLKEYDHHLDLKQMKKESIEEQLSLIEKQNQNTLDNIKRKAKEKKDAYREVQGKHSGINGQLEQKRQEYQEIGDKLGKKNLAEDIAKRIKEKRAKFTKEIEFFQTNDRCPTCYQNIDEDFVPRLLEKREGQVNELDSSLEEINTKLEYFYQLQQQLEDKSKEIRELQQEKQNLQNRLEIIKDELNSLQKEYNEQEQNLQKNSSDEKDNLRAINSELQEIKDGIAVLSDDQQYQYVAQRLLRDDGIKATIIRKYLPVINQKILEFLDKFQFHTAFRLDEEFNEEILARYHDNFSYENFSAGERSRIDMALLFAWRDVAQKKNSVATNLLILDEILDSSCDQHALECLMEILLEKASNGTKIMVISHRNTDMFYDKFESQLTMEKDSRGFSRIGSIEK